MFNKPIQCIGIKELDEMMRLSLKTVIIEIYKGKQYYSVSYKEQYYLGNRWRSKNG